MVINYPLGDYNGEFRYIRNVGERERERGGVVSVDVKRFSCVEMRCDRQGEHRDTLPL